MKVNYKIILVIVIIINVGELFYIQYLKRRYAELQNRSDIIGREYDNIKKINSIDKVNYLSTKNNYSLLIYLPDGGCGKCINNVLFSVRELLDQKYKGILVYHEGITMLNQDDYNGQIEDVGKKNIFYEDFYCSDPFIMLIDKNGNVMNSQLSLREDNTSINKFVNINKLLLCK